MKNTSKTKINSRLYIPRWAIYVITILVVIIGIVLVYNSYASSRTADTGDGSGANNIESLRKNVDNASRNNSVSNNTNRNKPRSSNNGGGGNNGNGGKSEADKLYIYNRESGNNPAAVNSSSGACGLGQFLPCHPKIDPCRLIQADYGCQDGKFTAYMQSRYGSWSAARAFWDSHHWW